MKFSMLNSSLKVASRGNFSGRTRSRPLLVKPSLPTLGRIPASLLQNATRSTITTAIATRRSRIPARARATVDIIFRGVPDIHEGDDVSHSADAPQPATCSSSLEVDATSLILSALAESSSGQSDDPAYFNITNFDTPRGPETKHKAELTTPVAQADISGDDLPDYDEDEHMSDALKAAPHQVQSPSAADEAEVYSDADDNDPASESILGGIDLHPDDASTLDAESFLDNILSPLEDADLLPASPHFDSLTPYDPDAYLDDPDFALEVARLFPQSLAAHSPVQPTKRKRSESLHDEEADEFIESQKKPRMQNNEVVAHSIEPLVLHSPVIVVKRKRSESQLDDDVNVSSEAQKKARTRIDEELNVFQPIASTVSFTHVAMTDLDIVSGEQSSSSDILPDAVSPVSITPVASHCVVPIPSLETPLYFGVPVSFGTYRESIPLIKNEHDILGIYAARHEDIYSDDSDIQDMEVVDPAMDILNSLFSSKLRLDVCSGCQATRETICQRRLNCVSVAHCDNCSSPFIPHCACASYSARRIPLLHKLIRPPLHVPYLRTKRTLWHGGLHPPMDVDKGLSLAELGMLELSVPSSKVSLDRRRRRRKESRSGKLR